MADQPRQAVVRHVHALAGQPHRPEASDQELLSSFTERRDAAAFAALVRRHGPMVREVCRRLLSQEPDVDDAFQATFLVLLHRARSIRKRQSLGSWLYGVAYRVAEGAKRDTARRHCREWRPAGRPPTDPAQETAWRELCAVLDVELYRLAEAHRAPLVLCYLEGRTRDEAARQLGWSLRTLDRRLEQARDLLRRRLTRRGLSLSAALLAAGLAQQAPAAGIPSSLLVATIRDGAGPLAGRVPAAAAAALAEGVLKRMAMSRLPALLAAVLAVGLVAAGAGLFALPTPDAKGTAGQAAAPAANAADQSKPGEKAARADRYGDPLPPDALLRLGTLRHRSFYPNQALPDGKTLLLNADDEIRWIDLATGRTVDSWPLPAGHAVCGFSRDGRLALLSDRKTFRLWDLTRRTPLQAFQPKDQLGTDADALFAPDGKIVVTNSGVNYNPGLIRAWDAATGSELWQEGVMGFYDRGLWPLGFLPDEKTLVVLDKSDYRVCLRDRATGRQLRSFPTMSRNDSRMSRLSPDGKWVVMGTAGCAVRAWDIASGKERPPLVGHKEQAHSFAFSSDGKTILTGGGDRFVVAWDWPAGKVRRKIDLGAGRTAGELALSLHGEQAKIVIWGENKMRSFDLPTGRELPLPAEAHRASVNGLAIARDGMVVSAGTDNTIRVWDLNTGQQLHEHPTTHPLGAMSLALSADGKLVATADVNSGTVAVHARDSGRLVRTITSGESAAVLGFAPEGRLLAVRSNRARPGAGGGGSFVALVDADTGRETRRLEAATWKDTFSPDGHLLAGIDNNRARLWDVTTGREQTAVQVKDAFVLAFTPDGRTLAWDDATGITLWELAAGKERCRIEVPGEGPSRGLRFSPDGRWLARGQGRAVQLFDAFRGQLVHTFARHDSSVTGLAFAPDGRKLASSSYDSTILIWDVASVAARQPAPQHDSGAQAVATAWAVLASADAKAAYRALRLLAEAPALSLPLAGQWLRPAQAPDAREVQRWIDDLDSGRFAARERAVRELARLAEGAAAALRRFLAQGPAPEARRRVEQLLDKLQGPVTDPERLRQLRALELLERIATREARQLLQALTQGAPEARLTQAAQDTLRRLSRASQSLTRRE
jgi:RNA polymerase sigma factor (sigma-70 family)